MLFSLANQIRKNVSDFIGEADHVLTVIEEDATLRKEFGAHHPTIVAFDGQKGARIPLLSGMY